MMEESETPTRKPRWEGQPPGPWHSFKPVLTLWIMLLAINGVIGLIVHFTDNTSPALDLIAYCVFAIVVLVFLAKAADEFLPLVKRLGVTRTNWWLVPAALVVVWIFMTAYMACIKYIGLEEQSYLDDYRKYHWPVWSAFLLISLAPGVVEELAFRGFIMSRLMKLMKPYDALTLQAAMFSILHLNPLIFVSHFVMGWVIGFLRLKTSSLYPCILLHMLWNGFVVALEYFANV